MDQQQLEAHLNRPLTEIEKEIFDQWGHTGVLDPLEKHVQAKIHKPPQGNRLRDLLAQYELDESISGIQELARKVPIWLVKLKDGAIIYTTSTRGIVSNYMIPVTDAYIADPRKAVGFCDVVDVAKEDVLYYAKLSQDQPKPDNLVEREGAELVPDQRRLEQGSVNRRGFFG